MPPPVRLEMLGGFRAARADGTSCRLPTRKCEALAAYLALPAGRFHSRDALAALLWGDTPEPQARQSLRQALGSLRRVLDDGILTRGDTVALDPGAVIVDIAELEAVMADGGTAALERVGALYRGEFLAGFRVSEAPFEEWRTVQRERLHELAIEALVRLLRDQTGAERVDAAIQTAMRILALDPLQEAVHRVLMRLLLRQGRRGAALRQYQTCVMYLERELGTEPEEETRQLYREILRTTGSTSDRRPGPPQSRARVAGIRVVDTPLIGRAVELERLNAAMSRMLDDGGHVVLVSGEAGIGKSRLIQEALATTAGRTARTLFGRCHQTEQTLPFRPWIEALRGDGATLDAAVQGRLSVPGRTQLASLFPELLPSAAGTAAGWAPALLFEPMLELIGALAADQPLIVTIEDLHWADAMSAGLLAFLGRRIARLPILIVGSLRPEELVDVQALAQAVRELREEDRLDEVALAPLSEAESEALASALRSSSRGGEERDRLAREIWTVSGGNPFVIEESMRSLAEQGPQAWARGSRVGRRVQDLIAARLESLGALPRQCVAAAATIGRDFSFALLHGALGVDERETAEAVEALVRRRILDAVDDRLDFRHDWVRLVAYESLLPPTRRLLHAAVGDALAHLHRDRLDDVADQLGGHYFKAGDVAKAMPHLVRFGDLAAQRYALDDAYRAFAQAVTGLDRLPPEERDRCRLDVALRQAFLLSVRGRQNEILELLRGLDDVVRRVADAALTSEYYFRLGLTRFFLGDRAGAQHAAARALELAEGVGDPERIGKALHVLSLDAYETGRPREGMAHATRAIALLEGPGMEAWLGLVYQDLALNSIASGDLEGALAATRSMEAIGRTSSVLRLIPFAGYVAAWVHALAGDTGLAVETAERALGSARDTMVRGLIGTSLGYAYLEQGAAAAAVARLTEALDQLGNSPVRHVEIRTIAFLGEACLLAGDPARARELAERALELGQAGGMPLNVGFAQRLLGRIGRAGGDLEAADRWLSQALTTFNACAATFEAGRTYLDLAAVRTARGQADAARGHLRAALAVFEAARAPARAAEARALGRALGLVPTGAHAVR
jgi:DNA-binding SARP family transcriptional activator